MLKTFTEEGIGEKSDRYKPPKGSVLERIANGEDVVLKNYINGKWVESKSDEFLDVTKSATGEILAKVPMSTEEEVNEAIGAAKEAFQEWSTTRIYYRLDPLYELVQEFEKCQDELARVQVDEHGKEYMAAYREVRRLIQMVQDACANTETQKGEFSHEIGPDIDEYSVMRPLGVFVVIPPFNFPIMVPWWFAPWAIACGDTYIIKPNEQCPISQQRVFEIIDEKVDLPPGIINLVNGGPRVANQLITHPDIEGVSFVGSTPVAKHIYKTAAEHGKRAQCQAGANNYLVIMPDANVDAEVFIPSMIRACFGNTGQRCLTGSIAVGVGEIYEELREKFVAAARGLKIGYGMDEEVRVGPVVSKKALEKLHKDIESGLKDGAKLLLDGRNPKVAEKYKNGYFLGPTIFEGAKQGMHIYDDEVFGPVMCMREAESLDEVIKWINDSPYGNSVTIYTESGKWAREFREKVKVGNVGINIGIVAPMSFYPFAGMKDSFFGDLHGQSKDAVNFFTDRQVVIRRWFGPRT